MLGKLVGLFVETDQKPEPPKPKDVKSQPQPQAAGPTGLPAPAPVARVATTVVIPGQVDPEMAKILEDAIQESNIPGFDYIEFRDVLANMAGIPMTEQQKFQAAFAAAQMNQITKVQLIEAIDFYIKVIETKGIEFVNYVTGLKATDVDGKSQQIADLETQISEAATKIQELTEHITALRKQQDGLRLEQTQAENDINGKSAAFESTKAAVIAKLTSDRTKIETYIPN